MIWLLFFVSLYVVVMILVPVSLRLGRGKLAPEQTALTALAWPLFLLIVISWIAWDLFVAYSRKVGPTP